jgi:hypothetical protein
MDSAKQQLTDKLKTANNVLVTVSRDPSVDQLAACLGLTLLLNKQGKHAAAVFSGQVPSTLEFLKPEETLEKNTDSLRDFIIALDRAKADKLRYKVEDNVVRIFITPYKTSISQDDLEFSEGDFNVDLVIALGVHKQEDLDEAIIAHGRILHDATVASINTTPDAGLGTINWYDADASSLSELITELIKVMGDNLLDNQIATALLTGIVSETDRFSNDKTSSQTMSASAVLMAAGADQQLVASKLEETGFPLAGQADGTGQADGLDGSGQADGTLKISHGDDTEPLSQATAPDTRVGEEKTDLQLSGPGDSDGNPLSILPSESPTLPPPDNPPTGFSQGPKLMTEPPTLGGRLTANSSEEKLESAVDPLSLPREEAPQLLDRKTDIAADLSPPGSSAQLDSPAPLSIPSDPAGQTFTPPPAAWTPLAPSPSSGPSPAPPADDGQDHTLTELELSVNSPHIKTESVDEARDEVKQALNEGASPLTEPIQALGAQQMGGNLHSSNGTTTSSDDSAAPQDSDSGAPPPVPPPIPFQFGNSPPQT